MARRPANTVIIDTRINNNNDNNNITYIHTQTTTIKYTPIHLYKSKSLPLTFGVTLATTTNSIPPFQSSFVASASNRDSLNDTVDCEMKDSGDDGIEVEIVKLSKNRRRIRSTVVVDASLDRIWGILTDYERLADFIPSLVVSQVLDKRNNFARLLQVFTFFSF